LALLINTSKKKDILNLGILLHDIGKGYGEDHCKVGAMIAAETAIRLGLKEEEQQFTGVSGI